ncbi:MAG TPA: glycine/sarcosine/betaine reductase selenoprotein B family protein [Pyrinomonadaceae bacterium]|nr:glycine/sarcosine/betaine reductase selenoprotein B family protein [Pyrinomonadaceae bacterium]
MEIIERMDDWQRRYGQWQQGRTRGSPRSEVGSDYPFVENRRAPFTPARRALPMLNLALISSAGAYINGTESFDTNVVGGDTKFREIPREVEAEDLLWCARGWDTDAATRDRNAQAPIDRLAEFEGNGIIGQLNPVWWSFCGHVPDASRLVEEMLPKLIERVKRYEVQAALVVPASRLCHQSSALVARGLEAEGIPTMMLGVEKDVVTLVRPPRCAYYRGELGSVAGRPNWPEHQRRILDEALRLIEPMDQPGIRQLTVELQSQVEKDRGER